MLLVGSYVPNKQLRFQSDPNAEGFGSTSDTLAR